MSVGKYISIDDTATPWLRELTERVSPIRMAAEVGPRCTRLVQRNFRSLESQGNKHGWPSTHFAANAARATSWKYDYGYVFIDVNQIGLRYQLEGGEIKPINVDNLAYPAAPEAAGKRPREFSNLVFGILPDPEHGGIMRPCLKEAAATHIRIGKEKKKGGERSVKALSTTTGLVAIFWLSKGVSKGPDPRWMPTDAQFQTEFDTSIEALLRHPTSAK